MNLRYELARLGTDYYLSGVSVAYQQGKAVPPPRYVLWDCTRRCNLHCLHCGATGESYAEELTTAQICSVVEQLAALRVEMFAVTGGEPLLRPDLLEVLSYAGQRGMKTGIATNGFLLNAKMAQRMATARVHSVQVSLDGLEDLHTAIRGHSGSFVRAVNAVQSLQQAGVPLLSVATTVTPYNLEALGALYSRLEMLRVKMWRLSVIMPIGRALENPGELTPAQLIALLEFIKTHDSPRLRVYLAENLPYLGPWEKRLRHAPLICPVGFTACCIGVDGHVRGCPELDDTEENREGSILEQPFAQIWQQGFGRYRERRILMEDRACTTCKDRRLCWGGCWVMRSGGRQCIYPALGMDSATL